VSSDTTTIQKLERLSNHACNLDAVQRSAFDWLRLGANSDTGRRTHHSRSSSSRGEWQGHGTLHHYRKVLSPEPVIECLIYGSADPSVRLEQIEYIVAKSITRNGSVTLADWNKYWHDHKQEIATGRVQVLDLPPEEAKEVAKLDLDH
jgi:hypothetical protein